MTAQMSLYSSLWPLFTSVDRDGGGAWLPKSETPLFTAPISWDAGELITIEIDHATGETHVWREPTTLEQFLFGLLGIDSERPRLSYRQVMRRVQRFNKRGRGGAQFPRWAHIARKNEQRAKRSRYWAAAPDPRVRPEHR
jgi:hypothetical protein